ncbi:MAG TPA: choice-of-anchor Q domain-containing protein [Verrucomicrobiae bacterium]|jgi:hypothetical protein|nr:choice-of-anchor Q domain-containing protein [Verrucomicrobiae bacterium]
MKNDVLRLTILCLCLLGFRAVATTYYVDINSTNATPPYTNWSTAATDIQSAVNQTTNGDLVLVNPGVYQSGGYIAPDGTRTAVVTINAVTIQGVDGQAQTSINGSNTVRCLYLANGAMVTGFTLTSGAAGNGAGVYCASTVGTVVSNCVITANNGENQGGGAYQGTLLNCTVSQNIGPEYGAGAYNAVLIDCMVISNTLFGNNAFGGGVYNSDATNCVIADNSELFPNLQTSEGGGAYGGNLDHCNIVGNSAGDGGGTENANLVNCINYCNTATQPYDSNSNFDGGTINYSCTAPLPGAKDITSDPQLASLSHVSLDSPCRGTGSIAASSGVDIDGNPWANPPSIGCFEAYPDSVLGSFAVAISTAYTNWPPGWALNLQASISGPVYSNVWNFGDGGSVTNEAYVSHTWAASGTYLVTLTAYNDSYPAGIVATQMMFVSQPKVYYVNLNNLNPAPPYITWATAAIDIQDAVSIAAPGSTVLVTNGATNPYYDGDGLTNTAAFYMVGGTNAPDGNFYRVVITNDITVESVNGPATTYIWGITPTGPGNCVYLTNGAALSGFTVTNYPQVNSYGRITATSTNAVITNCLLTQSVTVSSGTLDDCLLVGHSSSANSTLNSCIISNNSQVVGGVLNNCLLVDNTNSGHAGPAMAEQGYPLVLNNCLISNNVSQYAGAVYNESAGTPTYYTNCVLNNCTLTRNFGQYEGGGAWGAELNNCLISSNTAGASGSSLVEGGLLVNCTLIGNSNGVVDGSNISPRGAILTNCTLIGNSGRIVADDCLLDQCSISQNAGIAAVFCTLNQCMLLQNGGGASASALNNCLLVSNVPPYFPTGTFPDGGGATGSTLTNCILAYNVATNGGGAYKSTLVNCTIIANTAVTGGGVNQCAADNCILYQNANGDFYPASTQYPLNYCCVSTLGAFGIRNITNRPIFVAPGNFHLQSSSPCINSGNNAYITASTDLDGNPRIAGGTVDIGAYEYQTPTSVISYAYLQQYGLPTDGSVDFADVNGTAFDVYQDWIAGLNPTNSASVLAMLTPVTTNTATGVTVTWQSVSGIPYLLQRSTNLASLPPFVTIQNNIIGQANTTSYTDTSATNGVPYFYRVGVVAP